jgi:nickel superoxide dismutase
MAEDIATIEKSMKKITKLSAAENINYNQLVRWIDNKETHADKFMDIVTQYFMAQRIKPVESSDTEKYDTYLKQIILLHRMLVTAMKSKQTTDLQHVDRLKTLLEEFKTLYLEHHSH